MESKECSPFDTSDTIEMRHLLRTRSSFSRPSTPGDFSLSLRIHIQKSSFVSDSNSSHSHSNLARLNGVMPFIRRGFPVYQSAQALDKVSVQYQYLVARLEILEDHVYIHSVYAPGNSEGSKNIIEQLPTGYFEQGATHTVCGDLNTTFCSSLDYSTGVYRHAPSRLFCKIGFPAWVFWMLGVNTS